MGGGLGSGCSNGLVSLELALDGSVSLEEMEVGLRCGPTEWVRCDFFLELFQGVVCWWLCAARGRWRILVGAHERR